MAINPTVESLGRIVQSRQIVLISHDLGQTGSPLLLVEAAVQLRKAGANVRLVTLGNDAHKDHCAGRAGIEIMPCSGSLEEAAKADLVIANTAATASWVNEYLQAQPEAARSLLWWIHEIDAPTYAPRMQSFHRVGTALFDSNAQLAQWIRAGLSFPEVYQVIHPAVDDAFMRTAAQKCLPYARSGIARFLRRGTRLLDRNAVRAALDLKPEDFVLVLLGLSPMKGHALFLRTVERMLVESPDLPIKMIVVGYRSGREKAALFQGLNRRAQKALRAIPLVADHTPYYAAADALVMNSQGPGESFGRVTVEAMAFRLPVLGTNGAGTAEIVQDGITGLLHPLGEQGQAQLAENIRALMNHRSRAKSMGDAGHDRVQVEFGPCRFYAQFASLLAAMRAGKCNARIGAGSHADPAK